MPELTRDQTVGQTEHRSLIGCASCVCTPDPTPWSAPTQLIEGVNPKLNSVFRVFYSCTLLGQPAPFATPPDGGHTARHHVLADVAGGEDDFEPRATFVHDLCELEAAHSRHPDIDEAQAVFGRTKQRRSVTPVAGILKAP